MNADFWHRVWVDLAAASSVLGGVCGMFLKLHHQVTEIHLSINSKMDQLLELTRTAAHAAGKLEGIEAAQVSLAASAGAGAGGVPGKGPGAPEKKGD